MTAACEKIKNYYHSGAWNKAMVRNAVAKGRISRIEYEMITGDAYYR